MGRINRRARRQGDKWLPPVTSQCLKIEVFPSAAEEVSMGLRTNLEYPGGVIIGPIGEAYVMQGSNRHEITEISSLGTTDFSLTVTPAFDESSAFGELVIPDNWNGLTSYNGGRVCGAGYYFDIVFG